MQNEYRFKTTENTDESLCSQTCVAPSLPPPQRGDHYRRRKACYGQLGTSQPTSLLSSGLITPPHPHTHWGNDSFTVFSSCLNSTAGNIISGTDWAQSSAELEINNGLDDTDRKAVQPENLIGDFLKEKSPAESRSVSRVFPTKGGNRKEMMKKHEQREHG